jgi:hypothetical protein
MEESGQSKEGLSAIYAPFSEKMAGSPTENRTGSPKFGLGSAYRGAMI